MPTAPDPWNDDFLDLADALLAAQVDFLVVGACLCGSSRVAHMRLPVESFTDNASITLPPGESPNPSSPSFSGSSSTRLFELHHGALVRPEARAAICGW